MFIGLLEVVLICLLLVWIMILVLRFGVVVVWRIIVLDFEEDDVLVFIFIGGFGDDVKLMLFLLELLVRFVCFICIFCG